MTINQRYHSTGFWCFVSLMTFIYAIWYSINSYESLSTWYLQLNPHFYKNDEWHTVFFTNATKHFGQLYSWILTLLVFIQVIFTFYQHKKDKELVNYVVLPKITKAGIAVLGLTLMMWWFWLGKASYSTDEVFSAVHFAAKPFFQIISQYPLPNNHLLFNAVNHFFSYITNDLVYSGRLLSGFATALTMMRIFNFSEKFITHKVSRFFIIIMLLSVFPIIGFATQARGYSFVLLFSWISLEQIYEYGQQKRRENLNYYIWSVVLGMWTMPSFLYWWVGLSGAFIFNNIRNKNIDIPFIFSSFKILLLTMVLYLPAITFSGWRSIFANKYVAAGQENYQEFIGSIVKQNYFQGLFSEWFGTGTHTYIAVLLLILPIVLILATRKRAFIELLVYMLSLFFSFLLIAILMKKLPFYRNLIGHCLLCWVFVLFVVGNFIETCMKPFKYFLSGLILVVFIYFTNMNLLKYPFHLYYYDVNALDASVSQYDLSIYRNKKVFIDDESFYWHTPIRKVTSDIHLGGTIDTLADILVIEKIRRSRIDTIQWVFKNQHGETEFWLRK